VLLGYLLIYRLEVGLIQVCPKGSRPATTRRRSQQLGANWRLFGLVRSQGQRRESVGLFIKGGIILFGGLLFFQSPIFNRRPLFSAGLCGSLRRYAAVLSLEHRGACALLETVNSLGSASLERGSGCFAHDDCGREERTLFKM